MIPLALLLLAAWVIFLVVRSKRLARANAQRDHRPNAPDAGHNQGAIVRSIMEGHAGSDR